MRKTVLVLVLAAVLFGGCIDQETQKNGEKDGSMLLDADGNPVPVIEMHPANEEECLAIEDPIDRDLCYYALASDTQNQEVCELIQDKQFKSWCLERK